MAPDPALIACAGAVSLALAAALLALAQKRAADARVAGLEGRALIAERAAEAAVSAADVFDSAVLMLDDGAVRLVSGADALRRCAPALGLPPEADALTVAAALSADPDHARRLKALAMRGEPCDFEASAPGATSGAARASVSVEGRASGALAWLRLTPAVGEGLPSATRLAAFLDALPAPAWLAENDGRPAWANRAWLQAVGADSLQDARTRRLAFDRGAEAAAGEAAAAGERREALRWISVDGRRRAFQVDALPLEGGGAGALALDVTEAEDTREALKRHVASHDDTLNRLADAVAIFAQERRLAFHNTAFAELWGIEPAWLAESPSHGELLDRLRQRRRLPETSDYAQFKARELGFYETLDAPPDELWSLPDGRTLRVVRQPHPFGGLLLLFSDITGELKLRSQYNALVLVQQATLDKLNDAVAVFGSDGRLRLHNEAFERFWSITPAQLADAGDFDGVAELCLALVHDRSFWRELKARVADPDPQARAPVAGEIRTSDRRIVVFQTLPLPDGATLVAFDDVTATRELEQALADRSTALAEAERLKRDFVGNVSYELRTPLTTIIGYSELLDNQSDALPERSRGYIGAVRQAAAQLARSIDDVLDMAQIDAGEMALSLGDVHVAGLLNDAAHRAERLSEEGQVTIEVLTEPDPGVIRADVRRLAPVLDHLIANAVRSTPPGGVVRLDAKRTFGEVQVRVSDTGRGIPYHVQAHIFDRFVGRDRGGPGLALALVKALVELHGGWVALESEPGAGATFTCHLPETAYAGSAAPELQLEAW
ncbi:cell cycle protein kinase DivL [soil metagenome]